GDDFRLLRAVVVQRVAPRELERRLVRLRAGIAEEDAIREGRVGDLAREAQHGLVGPEIGDDPELLRLLVHGLDELRMRVTQDGPGDAAGEIDVLPALLVPHARALSSHGDHLARRVHADHHFVVQGAVDRFGLGLWPMEQVRFGTHDVLRFRVFDYKAWEFGNRETGFGNTLPAFQNAPTNL